MPVTSSEFVYYGGFTVFSSAVFLPTPNVQATWEYYGGFHIFANTPTIVATSSGAVATTFRHLITHHYLTRLADVRF